MPYERKDGKIIFNRFTCDYCKRFRVETPLKAFTSQRNITKTVCSDPNCGKSMQRDPDYQYHLQLQKQKENMDMGRQQVYVLTTGKWWTRRR